MSDYISVPITVYDLTRLMDLSGVTTAEFAENLWNNVETALTKTRPFQYRNIFFRFNGIGGLRAPDVQTFVLV